MIETAPGAVLRGLLAGAPDGMIASDEHGTIVWVNDAAETMFRWPSGSLVGQPVEVLVPERFAAGHPALRKGFAAAPSARPMGAGLDLWALRADGTEFPAEISLGQVETEAGRFVAVTVRDVTITRRRDRRMRDILEFLPDAILGLDVTGRVEFANGEAEALFRTHRVALVGEHLGSLLPPATAERVLQDASLAGVHFGVDEPITAHRPGGGSFPAELSVRAVERDDGGQMVVVVVRDVSSRSELDAARQMATIERQTAQQQRLESLGQLAGGIAHDFNNLLGVIQNYAVLARRELPADSPAASDLDEIHTAARRAVSLVGQLLSFARRDDVNPVPVDLGAGLTRFCEMLRRTLGAHIQINCSAPSRPIFAIADEARVEQVLLNIAVNSRDAMTNGGTLDISIDRVHVDELREDAFQIDAPTARNYVRITVTDDGVGMSPDTLRHAFEPFFTTKGVGEGSGLGLASVHGIVHQMGGAVTLRSQLGVGTTVTLLLPAADDVAPPTAPRVLVVEDEPALRRVVERLLRGNGFEVAGVGNGAEAIAEFEAAGTPFDVLLTDLVMPRMGGRQLAAEIRRRSPNTRVIYMTGYDSAPEHGDDDPAPRLQKPFSEDDLVSALREVFGD